MAMLTAWRTLTFSNGGWRDAVAGDVDLTLLQAQQRHDGLLPYLEGDLVEVRQARVPVIGVLFEHDALAERPFRQFERTGANRVLAEIGTVFLDFFLGHHMREVDRHDVQEGRVGTRQFELHGQRIDDGDAGEPVRLASGGLFITFDRTEEALAGALRRRVHHALDRILHVFGRHLAAVVELDALAQLEGEGLAVRRDLVALGQIGTQGRGAGFVVHQAVEQALDHRPVLPIVADSRVERGHVVLVGDDDLAARLRVRIKLFGLDVGRGHADHQRKRRYGNCGCQKAFHRVFPFPLVI
jgi:hypothetical protein